jgi:hypothetical protein
MDPSTESIGLMPLQLQHVNIKLLVENFEPVDLEPLIPIFHSWIQSRVFGGELLLDIADYRHVPAGPGVILIGYEGDYSVDNTGNRLGVRYNRKAPIEGSNQDRLRQAARAALIACQRLEAEPLLGGKLRFNGQELELFFNDRLLTPNSRATREAAQADLAAFFEKIFGGCEYTLSYPSDPRSLFGVSVKAARAFPTSDLLVKLGY